MHLRARYVTSSPQTAALRSSAHPFCRFRAPRPHLLHDRARRPGQIHTVPWLRCLDGYVGSGGSEWVGGETDSDDDYYFPSGGSDGDDCDAYDYL